MEAVIAGKQVPNLVGLELEKAEKICALEGLTVRSLEFEESPETEGRVIIQSPAAGETFPEDGLRLVVSARNYLDYLPGIYRQYDLRQGYFLKRFLWLIKHPQLPIDRLIKNIHTYFQPFNTPRQFLSYLASTLALVMDESWDESRKRELIANIVKIYKLRGTPLGLKIYLKIYTGNVPEIIENFWPFNGFQVGVSSTIGVDSIIIGYVNRSHCFTVRIPRPMEETPLEMIRKIHAIIEAERPAHTNYYMVFAEPELQEAEFMQIGVASMIGVDSWVGESENSQNVIQEGKKDDRRKQGV